MQTFSELILAFCRQTPIRLIFLTEDESGLLSDETRKEKREVVWLPGRRTQNPCFKPFLNPLNPV